MAKSFRLAAGGDPIAVFLISWQGQGVFRGVFPEVFVDRPGGLPPRLSAPGTNGPNLGKV